MIAMEITTFALTSGHYFDDFVGANADIDVWLKRQPGFCSRRICSLDDGSIVDVLIWRSASEGRGAAERIMSETSGSSVHGMIDQTSVIWQIAQVQHELKNTGEA